LGTEEAAVAVFPTTAVAGGEGPGVEEHKEVEMDLGRRRRSGLVAAAMFRHAGGRRGSMRWSRGFLEVMWSC
jgi:hypothetical protein